MSNVSYVDLKMAASVCPYFTIQALCCMKKNLQVVIESSRCHKCHPLLPVREDADVLSHH